MKTTFSWILLLIVMSQASQVLADDDTVILKGKVMNKKINQPVDARVTIYINNDFVPSYSRKEYHGEFTATLSTYGLYIISITAPGYLETVDTLWVTSQKRSPISKTFYITPIEVGLTVTLNNIYFEFGNSKLAETSFPELDKAASFLRDNPSTTFEIGGHTDANGTEQFNLYLSEVRAQAVVDYLTEHGVPRGQLRARGYGETKLLNEANTPEADAMNRRVEITVLKTEAN